MADRNSSLALNLDSRRDVVVRVLEVEIPIGSNWVVECEICWLDWYELYLSGIL